MKKNIKDANCCFICKYFVPYTNRHTQGYCKQGLGSFENYFSSEKLVFSYHSCDDFEENKEKKLRFLRHSVEKLNRKKIK